MKRLLFFFFLLFSSSLFAEWTIQDSTQLFNELNSLNNSAANVSGHMGNLINIKEYLSSIKSTDSVYLPYLSKLDSLTTVLSYLTDIKSSAANIGDIYKSVNDIYFALSSLPSYSTSLSSISSSLDDISSNTSTLAKQSTLSSVLSEVSSMYDSIGDNLGSDVSSIQSDVFDILTILQGFDFDTSSLAKESTLSSIKTTLTQVNTQLDSLAKQSTVYSILSSVDSMYDSIGDNLGSDVSSIDSKLDVMSSNLDSLATENTLSSVDSKLTSIDSYFSQSSKVYNDTTWKSFRDMFTSTSDLYVPSLNNTFYSWYGPLYVDGQLSGGTITKTKGYVGRSYPSAVFSALRSIQLDLFNFHNSDYAFQSWLGKTYLPSQKSVLDSLNSSIGDSIGSDVSQMNTTLSDIKSLLENFEPGGGDSGGSEDPIEDLWSEFRETYLTLFDNQPISNYEIDYALIAWETNSVATKATLTQASGNFFDLCLAFAMDANKIAASESIFLHKILDYLPNLRPPEKKDTTEDESRVDGQITDVSGQISTLQETFNYEDLVFKKGATDFFDHDTITGQFDDESLPANVTIIIPPIFTFQTQVFNISTAGFADFFDYTRAFCAVLYYVLLCGFIWFVFKGFILCCTKFARVLGFVLQW